MSPFEHPEALRVVCHELGTPVGALRGLLAALARAGGDGGDDQEAGGRAGAMSDSEQREALELARGHVEHLAALLGTLRTVADCDARPVRGLRGRPQDTAEEVDIPALVRGAASAAGLRPDELYVRVAPEVTCVRIDGHRTRQVLTNLLDNARRHAGARSVRVDVEPRCGAVQLRVADTGPGLRPAAVAALASPAAHSDGTADVPGPHCGLGLWVCGQLVAGLGGRMSANGRRGGGLVVRVLLPVDGDEEQGDARHGQGTPPLQDSPALRDGPDGPGLGPPVLPGPW